MKRSIRQIVFKYIKPPIIVNSNSQAGEDKIVDYLFSSKGVEKINYIDIGAHNPVGSNNTYLFYLKQHTGVLVEPDQAFTKFISEVRPRDQVVAAAISSQEGEADFFVFNEPALNTLSRVEADNRTKSGKYRVVGTYKVQLVTIENIIQKQLKNTIPELISLDVEGVDYAILSSFDFERYPVPVWIVETCEYSENHIKPKNNRIIDLMLSKGYFVFADTYINTIFVNVNWFYDKD